MENNTRTLLSLMENKDGTEVIDLELGRHLDFDWFPPYNDTLNHVIYLPKGFIKKLIGRDLTWEDEPVTL